MENITNFNKQFLYEQFPLLRTDTLFSLKKKPSIAYNCIALTLGIYNFCVWPTYSGIVTNPNNNQRVFWPKELPLDDSLENFIKMYNMFDYVECNNDLYYEDGYTKIAIYAINNVVTHAALQLTENKWASKIGYSFGITHQLKSLEGEKYGKVVKFMKRDDNISFTKYSKYFQQ